VQGAVNVASGVARCLGDVARLAATHTGRPELLTVETPGATAGSPGALEADVTRLRDEVGWRPRFGLEEGLADAVAWHRGRLATQAG
jgi:nucleoside-diphosphate-sugar epimerase